MNGTDQLLLALELATWFSVGACLIVAALAIVARAASGTWHRADGIVDDDGTAIRWFVDDGAHAGHAELSDEQRAWLAGRVESEIYYRAGRRGAVRFDQPRSHARALWFTALGLFALGIAASIAQLVVLSVTG